MTKELIFTKQVARSGRGFLVWIPKDIVDFLKLDERTYVETSVRELKKEIVLRFTKRIAKSGRGYLLWIPKDVSDYLKLGEDSMCEFRISRLGGVR